MKRAKLCGWTCIFVLLCLCTGCRQEVLTTGPSESEPFYDAAPVYYYSIGDTAFLPDSLKTKLDAFGEFRQIAPASPTVVRSTEIPQPENNAKGTDPLGIVFPELDSANYSGPYFWSDPDTGFEVSAYYRMVAGMLTDELVKVYTDSEGSITQYEAVNLGKYDTLPVTEERLEHKQNAFHAAAGAALQDTAIEYHANLQVPLPSVYRFFYDEQGQLVLQTTVVLDGDDGSRHADLYAVYPS